MNHSPFSPDFTLIFRRQYLRRRGDTVRHIIHSLTDSSGELGGELELGRTGASAVLDEESAGGDADQASIDWENWVPAPSDADPSKLWTGKKPVRRVIYLF